MPETIAKKFIRAYEDKEDDTVGDASVNTDKSKKLKFTLLRLKLTLKRLMRHQMVVLILTKASLKSSDYINIALIRSSARNLF